MLLLILNLLRFGPITEQLLSRFKMLHGRSRSSQESSAIPQALTFCLWLI
jgi:hypothetical protein